MADVAVQDVKTEEPRIGGSGLVFLGGRLFNMADYNPALHGQKGAAIYEEMRCGDPEIAAGISRILWAIRSARWDIEPVDDSDEEMEIAAFCEKWIMGVGRTDPFAAKWQDILSHALLCVTDGFSAFEKIWGTDFDGRQVYARIEGILPKSVREFRFNDDGSLKNLFQYAYTDAGKFEGAEVPAEKLVLFTFGREANNLWGRPILRAVYKPWYWKDKLWRIDGMRHERHALGVTIMKLEDATTDMKAAGEALIREMRVAERGAWAVIDSTQDISITYPSGQGTDVIGSIKYMDEQISQALFSEFMHLGSSQSGSRAVATSKVDLFLAVLQGLATSVEGVGDSQLIIPLVSRNWGARKAYPKLKCEDLSKLSGTEMAQTISQMMTAGALTPSPEIEEHVREALQLPPVPDDIFKLMQDAAKAKAEQAIELILNPLPQPTPGTTAQPKPDQSNESTTPSDKMAKAAPVVMPPMWRDPMPHEAHADFAKMSAMLDQEANRCWFRYVLPVRKKQIEVLAKKAASASDAELKALKAPMQEAAVSSLTRALTPVYMQGRRSILSERSAQLGLAKADNADNADDYGEDPETKPTRSNLAWIKNTAEAFVAGMGMALVKRAVESAQLARNSDMPTRDVERSVFTALSDLSEPTVKADLAGVVAQTFVNGRNEQALSMASDVETAYYSSLLDSNVCDVCAAFDGAEHEPFDPTFMTPNPDCEGGARCRCTTIYVFRGADREAA